MRMAASWTSATPDSGNTAGNALRIDSPNASGGTLGANAKGVEPLQGPHALQEYLPGVPPSFIPSEHSNRSQGALADRSLRRWSLNEGPTSLFVIRGASASE